MRPETGLHWLGFFASTSWLSEGLVNLNHTGEYARNFWRPHRAILKPGVVDGAKIVFWVTLTALAAFVFSAKKRFYRAMIKKILVFVFNRDAGALTHRIAFIFVQVECHIRRAGKSRGNLKFHFILGSTIFLMLGPCSRRRSVCYSDLLCKVYFFAPIDLPPIWHERHNLYYCLRLLCLSSARRYHFETYGLREYFL